MTFERLAAVERRLIRRLALFGVALIAVGLLVLAVEHGDHAVRYGAILSAGLASLGRAKQLDLRSARERQRSALDAAGGQTADQVALQDVEQRHDR